jgi:chromatin assembly factor 1 subunit A
MKEEEKEAERKRKEAEKKKKEEEKEAERKRKEEEKRIKEENKEAERKRKEEEKKRKEEEKENDKKGKVEERKRKEKFALKYVKHAPDFRTEFDTSRKKYLEQILEKSDSEPSVDLNLRQYRENKGRSYGATWPLKDNNVGVIGK